MTTISDLSAMMNRLSRDHKTARILVVEDNHVNQAVILDMLEEVGMIAETADNGKIAVDAAAGRDFDLILMDIQMPVLDGLGATRAIRQLPGSRGAVPIVAVSANAFISDRQNCMDAGMNEHVGKPLSMEILYDILLRYLAAKPVAVEDEEAVLRRHLTGHPLIDVDLGLKFNRKAARYMKILHQFASSNHDVVVQIEAALRAADTAEARRLAHSLKGGAGMLGIVGVQKPAEELENRILAGDGLENLQSLLRDVSDLLADVLVAIQALP